MTEESPSNSPEVSGGNDLETLRDLLFGNQVRDLSRRLTELDSRVEAAKRDLKASLNTRADGLASSTAEQVATVRKELNGRIDQETKSLAERIDKLAAELSNQLQAMHKELGSRLDELQSELTERLQTAQEEARQRDDELRAELLALSAWLDDKKASRHDLGQMLEEIGQRLQVAAHSNSSNDKNKSKKS